MSNEVGEIRITSSAAKLRKERARALVRQLIIWVGIPTFLAIIYYSIWATPQYQSVAVITVQSNKGNSGGLAGLSMLLPGVASSPRDAMLVREFVFSRTMLDHLNKEYHYAEHYQNTDNDYWSRLSKDATAEAVFEFYTDHISMEYFSDAGTLNLHVTAFSPDKAQIFAEAILKASEDMINEMSERSKNDRIVFVKKQVKSAEERFAAARAAIVKLQGEGHDLSPTKSASAILGVRSQLESELAKAKAELSALQSIMTNQAPKVKAQRQKVRSLQGQVNAQNKRLVDQEGNSINTSIARFEPLLFEKEVAQKAFETAIAALELAHIEALRELRYLVRVSNPSKPDEATLPRRLWGITTVFALAFVFMAVIGMLGAALREHAKY